MRRRHNRRVSARMKPNGSWLVRLYRNGRPVARGTIFRPGRVTWTVPYNLVELGYVSDEGHYHFLGYDTAAQP